MSNDIELHIKRAEADECEVAQQFYDSLIDEMYAAGMNIRWVKDVYPARDFTEPAVKAGEMYFGMVDGEIASAMVLNSEANEGYYQVEWPTAAEPSEVMVIHALGVHPRFVGNGLGMRMIEEAMRMAREQGMKVIRIDVLKGVDYARNMYVKLGFASVGLVCMFYENTGTGEFELFEYAL